MTPSQVRQIAQATPSIPFMDPKPMPGEDQNKADQRFILQVGDQIVKAGDTIKADRDAAVAAGRLALLMLTEFPWGGNIIQYFEGPHSQIILDNNKLIDLGNFTSDFNQWAANISTWRSQGTADQYLIPQVPPSLSDLIKMT